jgi:hypothetical protein
MRQRINRIGGFTEMKLDVTTLEIKIICDRSLDQIEAIEFMQEGFTFFMRILWRDDKPNLIHIRLIQNSLRNHQMTVMNGVE